MTPYRWQICILSNSRTGHWSLCCTG